MLKRKLKKINDVHYALDQLGYTDLEKYDEDKIVSCYISSLLKLNNISDFGRLFKCLSFLDNNQKFLYNLYNKNDKYSEYFKNLEFYGTDAELDNQTNPCIITNPFYDGNYCVFGEYGSNTGEICFIKKDDRLFLNIPYNSYYIKKAVNSNKYNVYDKNGVRLLQAKYSSYCDKKFDLVNNLTSLEMIKDGNEYGIIDNDKKYNLDFDDYLIDFSTRFEFAIDCNCILVRILFYEKERNIELLLNVVLALALSYEEDDKCFY